MAGNVSAGLGRLDRAFVDLTDLVGPGTAADELRAWDVGSLDTGWPAFGFLHDLWSRILDVISQIEENLPSLPERLDKVWPDIDPVDVWAHLQSLHSDSESSSNPKFASAIPMPSEDGSDAGSHRDKIPDEFDLGNWPPAGWEGFDKGDPDRSDSAPEDPTQPKHAPGWENPVSPVSYATKLVGTSGDEVINGTDGNDIFYDDGGNDVLNGGAGDDAFYFIDDFGQDVVTGFTAGSAGGDFIQFCGTLSDFDDVLAASSQVGPNVLIEVDDSNAVALIDVALSSLNQDDFRFV